MCPFTGQQCLGAQCAFNDGYYFEKDCLILQFLRKELGK